jgi:hypothetical protein
MHQQKTRRVAGSGVQRAENQRGDIKYFIRQALRRCGRVGRRQLSVAVFLQATPELVTLTGLLASALSFLAW